MTDLEKEVKHYKAMNEMLEHDLVFVVRVFIVIVTLMLCALIAVKTGVI